MESTTHTGANLDRYRGVRSRSHAMRRRGTAALVLAVILAASIWQPPFFAANATVQTLAGGAVAGASASQPSARVPTHIHLPRPPDRCSYASGDRDWPPADQTVACVRHRGSGPTVLLVGDSHAEQWAPALTKIASARDWTLLSLTRAKCSPWNFSGARPTDHGSPTLGDICQSWKKIAYPTVISTYQPDLVLIAGRPQVLDIRLDGQVIARSDPRWMPIWRRSWKWLVRVTTADSANVGALTLLPTLPAPVPRCLHEYRPRDDPMRHASVGGLADARPEPLHPEHPRSVRRRAEHPCHQPRLPSRCLPRSRRRTDHAR